MGIEMNLGNLWACGFTCFFSSKNWDVTTRPLALGLWKRGNGKEWESLEWREPTNCLCLHNGLNKNPRYLFFNLCPLEGQKTLYDTKPNNPLFLGNSLKITIDFSIKFDPFPIWMEFDPCRLLDPWPGALPRNRRHPPPKWLEPPPARCRPQCLLSRPPAPPA